MGFWLLVFFLTPIIEMYLLIRVGGYIGAWPTIALVMLTAVIGVALLRAQGLATLTRGMSRLEHGELPAREMAEGILLAVAGALLITPGFVTDTFGFLLLVPAGRGAVARRMLDRVHPMWEGPPGRDRGQGGASTTERQSRPRGRSHTGAHHAGAHRDGPRIIEGEFESRTDDERRDGGPDDGPRRPLP